MTSDNQVIAEYMGLCWHEMRHKLVICAKCKEWDTENPDFLSPSGFVMLMEYLGKKGWTAKFTYEPRTYTPSNEHVEWRCTIGSISLENEYPCGRTFTMEALTPQAAQVKAVMQMIKEGK